MADKTLYYPNAHEAGYTFCRLENFSYITHLHQGMECVYVLNGNLQATIDGRRYLMQKGDICVVMPYYRHAFRTRESSEILGFSVQPEHLLIPLPIFERPYRLHTPVWRAGQYSAQVPVLFDILLQEHGKNTDLMIHAGLLNAIFGYLFSVNPPVPDEAHTLSESDRVLLYLHDHISRPITLLEAAEALGVSQFKLSRICNQEIGIGFNAYLRFMRVTMAKRRLAFSDLSMSEIAQAAGFESLRTFNRAFSRETGTTPRDYRLRHKNKTAMNLHAR